jgi:mRNA deadenylase 3'-5' endonuclease subunit Ccr4
MKILNLVTYNILATVYCNKESYPYLDSKLLNHKYRSIQIKKELLQMIQRECVICLQEVNYEWYSDLLVFFNKNNYNLIIESYGNIKNDYMGVAIAHPKDYPIIFY